VEDNGGDSTAPSSSSSSSNAGGGGAWYPGTISSHRYIGKTGKVLNMVSYDDGDEEELYDHELQDAAFVRLLVAADAAGMPVAAVTPSSLPPVVTPSSSPPVPDTGMISSSSSSSSPSPTAAAARRRTATLAAAPFTEEEEEKKEEEEDDDDDAQPCEEIKPDAPPASTIGSAAALVVSQVLSDASLDSRVKQEGSAASLSLDERQRRNACREQWIMANIDPKTKQGRFFFRRGCHKQCITQVLGGSGVDPWPIVNKVPALHDIHGAEIDNPFIKKGEFYVAGNEDWNPFGPRFPGDAGFVNTEAFDVNPGQDEFHLFVQCSDTPHKRHWHGPDAAGGRMYVGVYKRSDDQDNDEIVWEVSFRTDLDQTNKMTIATFIVKRDYKVYGAGNLRPAVQEAPHFRDAARLAVGDNTWNTLTSRQRDNWTMLEFLTETNFTMDVVPVQFVRFDEALYQSLVESGAVMTPNGRSGHVSLEPTTLGQYY
jgi:hypothetical protein